MPKVEVEGLKQLQAEIRSFEDSAVTKAVNKEAADVVQDRADDLVPVRSGRLRGTGRTSGTKASGVVRYGRAKVPYAKNIHFGDLDRPQGGYVLPNPFLYDAVDDRRDQVLQAYQDQLDKLTKEFNG